MTTTTHVNLTLVSMATALIWYLATDVTVSLDMEAESVLVIFKDPTKIGIKMKRTIFLIESRSHHA